MDISCRIHRAAVSFCSRELLVPLRLSSGTITTVTEAQAEVTVSIGARKGTGRSSIYLSDLWAWPDPAFSHEQRDATLQSLCRTIAEHLAELTGDEPAHPLELGMQLHDRLCSTPPAARVAAFGHLPALAKSMCCSPFDAAVHDAAGHALELSAFELFSEPVPMPSVDRFFPDHGAAQAIADVLQRPRTRLDAWLVVGSDETFDGDVAQQVAKHGYGCFKLKLTGKDNAYDVERTVTALRVVREAGVQAPRLTVDSNEANPDAASVLDYLTRLRQLSPEAFASIEYLEQPTDRDITVHRNDWRQVTALKPVMLDEGLTDLELLPEALSQGWSGLALKTCKGHSFALAAAAWAHGNGMALSLQDLTNPGYSLIHAALMGAHLPTLNGVELNSPQFTPSANDPWLPRLSSLFLPSDGMHRIPHPPPPGLGSAL